MARRDSLCLSRAGRPIRTFPLNEAPLEVGSHPRCDITVHAAAVPRRALLVCPAAGTVLAYDLGRSPGARDGDHMPVGSPFPIGDDYTVTRIKVEAPAHATRATERIGASLVDASWLSLVVGMGAGARTFHVRDRPVSVGSAPDNAIRMSDRAVSRYHCRIEPCGQSVSVRDLESTNGTWVDGVRVHHHVLRPGASLRVGRTDLRVAARVGSKAADSGLVAIAAPMLAVLAEVERFARLPWPVLVKGETGVGKEHIARALHERGTRRDGPFVALNGGGLPRELIESELFGHEKGAFTGALHAHRGAFEQAHRGTLFLDEVAELPLGVQTRLLRVLETWQVRRVGGEERRGVDVRLVCATHADLRGEVKAGRFREDLFYRIHRMVLDVPPLRARRDDIAPLAKHFLRLMEPHVGARTLSPDALARLRTHSWPGNVRELRNALELAAVESSLGRIEAEAVARALHRTGEALPRRPPLGVLRETLDHYQGNVSAAARALGIPRSTFRDRLRSDAACD